MSEQINEKSNEIVQESQKHARTRRGNKLGILLTVGALLLVGGAAGYGYLQLTEANKSLLATVDALQRQVGTSQSDISALQQATQKSQDIFSKQEQVMSDWAAASKGDMSKWYVAEAQFLTRLANDYLQYGRNVGMAITLLQRADQILLAQNDAALNGIRQAIAVNITSLQSVPKIDTSELYTRLAGLNQKIDQLPLPIHPMTNEAIQVQPVTIKQGTPWYQIVYDRGMEALRRIVIVRNVDQSALPLVMPEEKIFLYQNLHAQLEAALWSVLHQDTNVFQASINRMLNWARTYFNQDADVTKELIQTLEALSRTSLQMPSIDLTPTLQMFDNYFAKQQPTTAPTRS